MYKLLVFFEILENVDFFIHRNIAFLIFYNTHNYWRVHMVDFTNAYNNISFLYQSQERDVIQYHFVLHGHRINVSYTTHVGLSRQISVTFETPTKEVVFLPVRIIKNDAHLLISARVGEYMSLLYSFFSNFIYDGHVSTTLFFEELTERLENLSMDDLRYESIYEFDKRIRHTNYPRKGKDDYTNPYFFNIIHKNLSDRMKEKIFDMYDNPYEIIKFLKRNGLTLAFTEDINKARDFYTIFEQRRLELEGKC